ncbi:MAG: hypothetical protein M3066_11675 [Actinomycetota bacterium]|nr:hypothetical protein [Actinomycetota bacterium]
MGCLLGAAITVIGVVAGSPVGAQTAPGVVDHLPVVQAPQGPVVADFDGRKIDLSKGWADAQACLVWRQGGVVQCFRTNAELDARERQLEPQRRQVAAAQAAVSRAATTQAAAAQPVAGTVTAPAPALAASSYSCSSSLDLYDYTWYGGRRLSFWDRGLWQNVGDFGFNDQLSSYIVGACYVYLAEHDNGGGAWYPGVTSSYHPESSMVAGWDNQVSSLYIT